MSHSAFVRDNERGQALFRHPHSLQEPHCPISTEPSIKHHSCPDRDMANATELKIVLIPGPSPGDDKDAGLDNFDAIGDALQSLGHEAVRVESIFTLVEALAEGKHHEWDLVLNLAEGLRGSAKVAQVTSLCEAYGLPCVFSDARTLTVM